MGKIETSNRKMVITSYGSMGGLVTGSCHEIGTNGSKFLVDVGMFQGRKEEISKNGVRRNFSPLSEIAKGTTDILVTHSHNDHTGRLPIIFKNGFSPDVLATEVTAALLSPMLRNSAAIQSSERDPGNRLYDIHNVEKTLRYTYGIKPNKEIEIGQKNSDISAEFLLNGHILGSSSILVRNPDCYTNVLFTGDMGKPNQSLCGGYLDFVDNYPNDPINALVIESTNFEREPIPFVEKEKNFLDKINEAFADKGNVLIMALAQHRTQEIVELIINAKNSGKLPSDINFEIDGPLSVDLTGVFRNLNPKYVSRRFGDIPDFYKTDKESMFRFDLAGNGIHIIGSHEESILNDKDKAYSGNRTIILASGGMGEHGRSVNYLKGDFRKNPRNTILSTCYQVEGTYGANMVYKAENSKEKMIGAKIYHIDGFTSHASGPDEFFDFLESFNLEDLETVIIGHGRETSRIKLAEEFERRGYGAKIITPDNYEPIELCVRPRRYSPRRI